MGSPAFPLLPLLLACLAASRSGATPDTGVNGEKSTIMYLTCVSHSDCAKGTACLEVLTETASALKGSSQCPFNSLCVCAEEWEDTQVGFKIEGKLKISVSNAAEFVNDPKVKIAMTKAVARLAGVPVHYVDVELVLEDGRSGRRLEEGDHADVLRQLQVSSGAVAVAYTILVPADEPGGAESLASEVRSKLSAASADLAAATGVLVHAISTESIVPAYTVSVLEVSDATFEASSSATIDRTSSGASLAGTALASAAFCLAVAQIS